MISQRVSTGISQVDILLDFLRIGDNVVFRVNNIQEYISFVEPFVEQSLESGNKVVYMRFASHQPIIKDLTKVTLYKINAGEGFDAFTSQVHNIIAAEGKGVFYVFDCLSELLQFWATDLMVGNFFSVTCPYLYELDTVAYFALYRHSNSFDTITTIRDTTQVFLDVLGREDETCIYPLKVWQRSTPKMFLPHIWRGQQLIPVTDSGGAAKIMADLTESNFDIPDRKLDYWDKLFLRAGDLAKERGLASEEINSLIETLCRVTISRDDKFISLAKEVFSLEDILHIKSRLIGSGLIGGKSVGMLIARKALMRDEGSHWSKLLERHDSFYVGSDVFYTYIVKNGLWRMRMQQRKSEHYFTTAEELKEKMLQGEFSENIKQQFIRMLEYFGQSPLIVRSSSLMEDGFGNAFAGKYESVFCVNNGSLEERYHQFAEAVRRVYSSSMNETALNYRLKKGLDQHDEQMALLVQRVSGGYRGKYFLPDIAGVGFSYNTFVWDKGMDPKAGMLRLVAGLGTRAVNRIEGDYARIAALDKPTLKPYAGLADYKGFSQQRVDVLNVQENCLQSLPLQKLLDQDLKLNLDRIGERDYNAEEQLRCIRGEKRPVWVITFDSLSRNSNFFQDMQKMLKTLERFYRCPVDVEFTVNFREDGSYQINLLQCRPLQVKGLKAGVKMPTVINKSKILFQSQGHFMGGSIHQSIQRIISVEPLGYSNLKEQDKHEVARAIGRLNKLNERTNNLSTILLGPGRWGSSIPSLGVPVSFAEISNVTVLSEVAYTEAGFTPELSYGTHFFQDLVENDIFYVALFPEKDHQLSSLNLLKNHRGLLPELLPGNEALWGVLKVYDLDTPFHVAANIVTQQVVGFFS